jgi:hypothetical protein
MTNFVKGLIVGFVGSAVIFGLIFAIHIMNERHKETVEYAEKQIEIQEMYEDYSNRDPDEFLETMPDVRGAADGAADEFIRKRDEALRAFRQRRNAK